MQRKLARTVLAAAMAISLGAGLVAAGQAPEDSMMHDESMMADESMMMDDGMMTDESMMMDDGMMMDDEMMAP